MVIQRTPTKIDKIVSLRIGQHQENAATQIKMDVSDWITVHPTAGFHILFKRPGEVQAQPVLSSLEEGILTWTVQAWETALIGVGYAEVRAIEAESALVAKSRVIPCSVEESIAEDGDVPPEYSGWVERILNVADLADDLEQSIADGIEDIQAEGTTQVGNVNTAGTTQVGAVQAKGEEVLNSIPADYSTLSGDVTGLKSAISDVQESLTNINGEYNVSVANFEPGNIAYSSDEIRYYDSTTRVRTKQGYKYQLKAGTIVKLSTYTGVRLYVGGSTAGSGWLSQDYSIPNDDEYFIVLRKEPETTITSVADIVSLLSIYQTESEINNLKSVVGTHPLSGWVYKKCIKTDGATVDLDNPVTANAYRYLVSECSSGDVFIINAKSGNAAYRPWCFVDDQGNVLTVSSPYVLTVDNYIAKAPENASKLIVNDYLLTTICYSGYTLPIVADKANQIDKIEGKSNTFNIGKFYWAGGNTPGTSVENVNTDNSTVRMCCMLTLPAGKILRVVGRINTTDNAIRVWRSYNQTTGKLHALAPSTTDIVSAYLCYDFDAHIYFNTMTAEDYYFGIIDQESPFFEIYKNHVEQKTSIMELNGRENVLYSLKTLRRPVRGKTRPFILAHFSDIHADPLNTPRVGEFFAETYGLIDAKISTGDMVYQSLDDGMDFWDESNLSDVLLAIGNHECATGTPTVVYGNATPQAVYEEVMASRISGWSVTQPENAGSEYLSYYYKDYATWKIRLIVLDLNHDSTYLSNQLTWLESVLASAKTSGYSVICASHYQFNAANNPTIVPCSFSLRESTVPQATNNWFIPATYETAVDDFIDGGGEFICWLGGHTHQDFVLLNSTGKQLCITVTTENFSMENAWSFGDDYRERYHRSQDAFNILGIDTYSKNISIFRIGNNLSRLMNSRNHLSINYANRTILFDD